MEKIANIVGATGLVGKQLLRLLIESKEFSEIKIFVRRGSIVTHPKVTEYIIDFDKPDEWSHLITGDVLFSTMGTTLKVAGSKEKQYKVDFSYQYLFAEAAAKNGVPDYVLVSSAGANAKSSMFYSRMKGELDNAVAKLSFRSITILRPSVLDGNRTEQRIAEKLSIHIGRFVTKFILKKYRPIRVEMVAKAMIKASLDQSEKLRIIELDQVFAFAEQ